jgi:hypothetical protein
MNILSCLSEVLALCLRELFSLIDDDVLFLAPLTTTHREVGLPTSTAQRGGYVRLMLDEESRTQVWRPYRPSMLVATEGLYPLGMVSSSRTTLRLALSQAPEHVEGEE